MSFAARRSVILALLVGTFACAGGARRGGGPLAASTAAPESVATAFFAAATEERWRDAAAYIELPVFEAFRQQALRPVRNIDGAAPSVEDLMASDPAMPRAVAEYQVKQFAKFLEQHDVETPLDFADVPTLDSLRRLSTEDAAARWLRAQDVRWQMRRSTMIASMHGGGCDSVRADSAWRAILDSAREATMPDAPRHEVLGAVRRDTVAWVLYRSRVFGSTPTAEPAPEDSTDPRLLEFYARVPAPSVLELRRRAAGWRIMPAPTMLSGGALLVGMSSMECRVVDEKPPRE